jgi:hypothetical protein
MPKSEIDPSPQTEDRIVRTHADTGRVPGRRRPLLKLRFYDDRIEPERSFEAKAAF